MSNCWIAFARENGTVYHTYTVSAPDAFVAPYFSFFLERTPKAQPADARTWRKDEFPTDADRVALGSSANRTPEPKVLFYTADDTAAAEVAR